MELPSRCSGADEEVFGKQETLSLALFPQRQGAQADLAEHAALAAGRQLDEGTWPPARERGGQKEEAGSRGDERKEKRTDAWVTLSDEGLTGVQQDVTALHDHPLDGQVLADVLRVAHLVVHHPGKDHPPSLIHTHAYKHTNTASGMCPNPL